MYCINCGVKLADTEKVCALCGTVPYHPEIPLSNADSLYPKNKFPKTRRLSRSSIMFLVTAIALLPILITVLCDYQITGTLSWSGYVVGAIAVLYPSAVLPWWFKSPNPVIFTSVFFVLTGVYLLFINGYTDGNWFLSFAFPVTGFTALLVVAVVTLDYYLKRGRLFIYGGAFVLSGLFMILLEFLLHITFDTRFIWWCLYPLIPLVLLGLLLIFFGISQSARESFERKFFI